VPCVVASVGKSPIREANFGRPRSATIVLANSPTTSIVLLYKITTSRPKRTDRSAGGRLLACSVPDMTLAIRPPLARCLRCPPRPRRLPSSRSYYSRHHPEPSPFPPAQETILSAALKRVPEHGFSDKALNLGATDVGYLDVSTQLFPRGAFDLINYYLVTQRLALKDEVQFPEDVKLGVGRKIRTLAMARLRANKNIIHQWQGVRFLVHGGSHRRISDTIRPWDICRCLKTSLLHSKS
jgi:hypothetical protein